MTHDQAIARALLAITRAGARAWRAEVGLFRDMRGEKHNIGDQGMSDLLGICPGGRGLSVEIKTGNARRRPSSAPGPRCGSGSAACYILARYSDAEDGDATIREALAEKNPDAS
jgi:hypothetical protein